MQILELNHTSRLYLYLIYLLFYSILSVYIFFFFFLATTLFLAYINFAKKKKNSTENFSKIHRWNELLIYNLKKKQKFDKYEEEKCQNKHLPHQSRKKPRGSYSQTFGVVCRLEQWMTKYILANLKKIAEMMVSNSLNEIFFITMKIFCNLTRYYF
ncbi:hypothetical protein C0J52_03192 [Blattella germanica]|nr:hypothetical protein C0J52_03192 [Blattella germanica]